MRALAAIAIAAAACRTTERDRTAPLPFGWPDDATAVVREHIGGAKHIIDHELTYDVAFARHGDRVRLALSHFRDGVEIADGERRPRDVHDLALHDHQPVLAAAVEQGSLELDLALDGTFVGTTIVDRTLDALAKPVAHAPADGVRLAAQARRVIDTPEYRELSRAHAADVWDAWFALWHALAPLPAPGQERTVDALGMRYTVRTISADAHALVVEAHAERAVTTEGDMMGTGAMFTATGAPTPDVGHGDRRRLDVSAELEPRTLRPRRVSVTWSYVFDDGPAPHPEAQLDYAFTWSR